MYLVAAYPSSASSFSPVMTEFWSCRNCSDKAQVGPQQVPLRVMTVVGIWSFHQMLLVISGVHMLISRVCAMMDLAFEDSFFSDGSVSLRWVTMMMSDSADQGWKKNQKPLFSLMSNWVYLQQFQFLLCLWELYFLVGIFFYLNIF